MKFKLVITNSSNKGQAARLLYGINANIKNFGLPETLKVEIKHKEITYQKILQQLCLVSCLVKFTSSTNNRQLFFYNLTPMGSLEAIEPHKNIDGSKRQKYRGESFKLGNDIIYEGDLFQNYFTNKWYPKKWNIADTHETVIWSFSNFIELYICGKQTFELEFQFIKS